MGVLALYIALLFICAFYGEKHASRLSTRGRMLMFSLTLGVYCSSWTFYGATGAAVREGIIFLPIYLARKSQLHLKKYIEIIIQILRKKHLRLF